MPASPQTDAAAPTERAPHARVGHAPTNDIKHRLAGAIESLCCCGACGFAWGECCCKNACEPPEPDTCFGVIRVLEQVIDDLKVLAGADDDDTALAPVGASGTAQGKPKGRAGKVLSAASRAQIEKALDDHKEGMRAHKRCARTLTDMLEALEEDSEDDVEGDEDGARSQRRTARQAAPDPTLSLGDHVAHLLQQRTA